MAWVTFGEKSLVISRECRSRDWGYGRIEGALSNRARTCPQYDNADPGTAWARARAGAEPENDVEGVSEPALGADCGHGFLHRRSVDPARAAAVYCALLHRPVYAAGGDSGHRTGGERNVDEPDRAESHGCGGGRRDEHTSELQS